MLLRDQLTEFNIHGYLPFLPIAPYSTAFGFLIVWLSNKPQLGIFIYALKYTASSKRVVSVFIAVFFLSLLSTAIEIGFTRESITRFEEFASQFDEMITKSRVSEQTFQLQIEISTIITGSGLQRATQDEDFAISDPNVTLVYTRLAPSESNLMFSYTISFDNRPENTEVFQVSVTPDPRNASNPSFDCNRDNGCYRRFEVRIEDDDGELSLYLSYEFLVCNLNRLSLLPR